MPEVLHKEIGDLFEDVALESDLFTFMQNGVMQ